MHTSDESHVRPDGDQVRFERVRTYQFNAGSNALMELGPAHVHLSGPGYPNFTLFSQIPILYVGERPPVSVNHALELGMILVLLTTLVCIRLSRRRKRAPEVQMRDAIVGNDASTDIG